MALFRRNVVGSDVIGLLEHIAQNEPVQRDTLIRRYYPGDADDADQSDQRKPLNDAIDFLVDSDQITETDDGYELTDMVREEPSIETALLLGIRSREGDDAAYNDVLDVLTQEDIVYFDRGDPLEDLLSGQRSGVAWNPTRLNYWRRMMQAIGVVQDINSDSDEEYTTVLTVKQTLLVNLLRGLIGTNEPAELQGVLDDLHESYLPVFSGTNRNEVATYFERALRRAGRANRIEVRQDSDFGPTVTLGESGVNTIVLRVGAT